MNTRNIKTLYCKAKKLIVPKPTGAHEQMPSKPWQPGQFVEIKKKSLTGQLETDMQKLFQEFMVPGITALVMEKARLYKRWYGKIQDDLIPPDTMTVKKISRDELKEWLQHALEDIFDSNSEIRLPEEAAVYIRALLILAETVFPEEVAVPVYQIAPVEDENVKKAIKRLRDYQASGGANPYWQMKNQVGRGIGQKIAGQMGNNRSLLQGMGLPDIFVQDKDEEEEKD